METTERIMARRQVHAEILSDPITITLLRKTKQSTSEGGWKWSDAVPQIPNIQVLIMPAKRRLSEMLVNTEMGDVTDYPFILLARHTANIKRDDSFYWNGDRFQVRSVYIKTEVSITAQIDYFGGLNNG